MTEFISWLIEQIGSVDPIWRAVIAGLAIAAETSLFVGLVIPGDTIVIITGVAVNNLAEYFWLLAAVLIGSMIGESLGYLIGRMFGSRIRASKLGQKIGEQNWAMADHFIHTRGGIAVAISRFLPVLHSLVPVVAGMTKMRYRVFLPWTVAACAVWAGIYISLGWIAGESWKRFAGNIKWGGIIFAIIVAVIVVLFHVGKVRLEKAAEKMIQKSSDAEAALAGGVEVEQSEKRQ